jgi:hypothetical protein
VTAPADPAPPPVTWGDIAEAVIPASYLPELAALYDAAGDDPEDGPPCLT